MNEVHVTMMNGTGANIDILCGFLPAKVEVINLDAAQIDTLAWYVGMADASAIKVAAGTRSKITTLGITMLPAATNGTGFRIGADTAVNISGQRLAILAYRGGEGNQLP